ncbi:MAG: amino acid ABC transporter substrate-binding protein, partial [Rubricoccaceae bacterium]|nr:amino acid ABC transporter substrate-binding protein [Rubricoccaceae bacterium]
MVRSILSVILLVTGPVLSAQPDIASHIPAAETSFQNGLSSYENGDFQEAYRLFTRAAAEFGYNERTTAAMLMAGKSAYADGDADLAISTL